MNLETLMGIEKNALEEVSKKIKAEDIGLLVDLLSVKEDKIRYQAFQLLMKRSIQQNDVYPYWENFHEKLKSRNSYQRSIGVMLLAENTRWDQYEKMENSIEDYLNVLNDEKPITIRQCIQAIHQILSFKKNLASKIAERLIEMDLSNIKETMRKLILVDILNILVEIRNISSSDIVTSYILKALSGGILGPKEKKQIETLL